MIVDFQNSYCVVGLGGHARNKLVPALLANNQKIAGFVSSQLSGSGIPGVVYGSIESALEALPADTVFVIATPPAMHFDQVRKVVEAGRDVFVEKPAFISAEDATTIASICQVQSSIVVEGFMYRHTDLCRRFKEYWAGCRDRIDAVDMVFLIPEVPPGTFRNGDAASSSCLFDMGCYAISLLVELQLPLISLRLLNVSYLGNGLEAVHIGGIVEGIKISIKVGVFPTYQNCIELRTRDGAKASFYPFFYGRPGQKYITLESNGTLQKESFCEADAFQAMFLVPRSHWSADQAERSSRMIAVATGLETLGDQLLAARHSNRKNRFR